MGHCPAHIRVAGQSGLGGESGGAGQQADVPAAPTATRTCATLRLSCTGRPGRLAGASSRADGWAKKLAANRLNCNDVQRALRLLVCANQSGLSPKMPPLQMGLNSASYATARVTQCKARPSPSPVSLPCSRCSVPLHLPWPDLGCALSVSPASGPGHSLALLGHWPVFSDPCSRQATRNPASPLSPSCRQACITGSTALCLPCWHARANAQFGAQLLPLATPSPSVSCGRHGGGLRPGPASGAGPLIRRFKASDARPLLDAVWH